MSKWAALAILCLTGSILAGALGLYFNAKAERYNQCAFQVYYLYEAGKKPASDKCTWMGKSLLAPDSHQ